tara:strand:+ start:1330 stop:2442 length:1113 start_codon:yes stop_codon:yes gene_type:complete
MNKLVPANRQVRTDKINRGRELTRTGDKVRGVTVGLQDIDSALFWYFENIIKPDIKEAGERVKVPVMYANPERWASIQRYGFIRDNKRKIMAPVIAFRRTSMTKDTNIPVDKLNATDPKIHYIMQSQYSKVNRYDKFSATRGKIKKHEMYSVAVPDYVVLSYDFTVWTNYTDQMNSIIEKINWSEGSYWGEEGKFKFRATIDSFEDASEFDSNIRNIKTNFSVTLNGYLLPDAYPPTADTTQQFITPSQLTMNENGDSTILSGDDALPGDGTTILPNNPGGVQNTTTGTGASQGTFGETLTLQAGANLVFSDILFDGSSPVTATIAMSDTPVFTSVSASTFSSEGTASFAALVVDGDAVGPGQEIDGGTF